MAAERRHVLGALHPRGDHRFRAQHGPGRQLCVFVADTHRRQGARQVLGDHTQVQMGIGHPSLHWNCHRYMALITLVTITTTYLLLTTINFSYLLLTTTNYHLLLTTNYHLLLLITTYYYYLLLLLTATTTNYYLLLLLTTTNHYLLLLITTYYY